MSVESATKFLEKMKCDEAFAISVGIAESPEKRWEILNSNGFDFTKEEFNSVYISIDAVGLGHKKLNSECWSCCDRCDSCVG